MGGLVVIPSFISLILGAAVGSFLNVVVYRIPAGISLLFPPSRCPICLHRLGISENVPILGWLLLRGRCRHCKAPIAVRYFLVEMAGAILFLLVFWRFSWSWQTLGYSVFLSWLLALALIDLDTMTLPNSLTQTGLVAGLGFQVVLGWQATSPLGGSTEGLMAGIVGAVLGIWLFDAITWIGSLALGQAAMGGGDAKLAAMIGAWLGWRFLLLSGLIACAIGALVGGGAIALGWLNRRQAMPFGPFLALGAGLTVFWGEALIDAYLKLFFPLG